jgi:Flp pilus assembly protein TadG
VTHWRNRRVQGDEGNALVEFVCMAVLLMVPLVYVVLTVFRVQGAAYAVSSAAREAGRVYATSDAEEDARRRAFVAASIVMQDSNLELQLRDLRIGCANVRCLAPGGQVRVVVAHDVPLPLLPRVFDRAPATVRVTGTHVELVDRFRSSSR